MSTKWETLLRDIIAVVQGEAKDPDGLAVLLSPVLEKFFEQHLIQRKDSLWD